MTLFDGNPQIPRGMTRPPHGVPPIDGNPSLLTLCRIQHRRGVQYEVGHIFLRLITMRFAPRMGVHHLVAESDPKGYIIWGCFIWGIFCLLFFLCMYLFIFSSIYLFLYLCIYLFIYVGVYLFLCLLIFGYFFCLPSFFVWRHAFDLERSEPLLCPMPAGRWNFQWLSE